MIKIEIVYATPEQQWVLPLDVPPGTCVKTAIQLSRLPELCPTLNWQTAKIGIFSKLVTLDTLVQAGDRIEIYRPLIIDPKQARSLKTKFSYKRRQ